MKTKNLYGVFTPAEVNEIVRKYGELPGRIIYFQKNGETYEIRDVCIDVQCVVSKRFQWTVSFDYKKLG